MHERDWIPGNAVCHKRRYSGRRRAASDTEKHQTFCEAADDLVPADAYIRWFEGKEGAETALEESVFQYVRQELDRMAVQIKPSEKQRQEKL